MNNEQQTWILKPGVRITNAGNFFTLSAGDEKTYVVRSLKNIEFNTLFTELDVAGLTRQVEELLDGDYRSYSDYLDWCDMPPKEKRIKLHSTAEQIVLLLLNQEKETK